MNRENLVQLLNSKEISLSVFIEAAETLGKKISSEVLEFIKIGAKHPIFSGHILQAYDYCLSLLIIKFQVNSIKDLHSNTVIKYY